MSVRKKVFLCYAKEDRRIAERLYHDLRTYGLEPWIDIESLPPGFKWREQIPEAIRACDFFAPLLSSRSVSKVGFVQREIKIALDYLDEHPADQLYLIPIRLDDCRPSHRQLTDIQWVDLFPTYEYGLSRILKMILPDLSDSPFEGMRSVLEFIASNSSRYVGFYAFSNTVSAEKTDLLVAVARELARHGSEVVLIDLELSAPQLLHSLRKGIPSLSGDDPVSRTGMAEILEAHFAAEPNYRWIDLETRMMVVRVGKGKVYILHAGDENSPYYPFRRTQDWQERIDSPEGIEFMNALRGEIGSAAAPDYVLISCPPSGSPLSGLSSLVLSEKLVFVWARNQAWSEEALVALKIIKSRIQHDRDPWLNLETVHFHPVFK